MLTATASSNGAASQMAGDGQPAPGAAASQVIPLQKSHGWYDIRITVDAIGTLQNTVA